MKPGCYIGVDVGGTKIAGALLRFGSRGDARVLAQTRVPARRGARQVVTDVTQVVSALTGENGVHVDEIVGIGIGVPGRVDVNAGVVENVANLGITRLDLAGEVRRATGVPVCVENDVNAAALGAYAVNPDLQGHGGRVVSSDDTFVFLNLGTGMAAGILRGGKPDRGFSGAVGEIGHIPVDPHRWLCACGQRGCLETVAGGNAIERQWPFASPPMPDLIAVAHDAGDTRHAAACDALSAIIDAIVDAIDVLAVTVDPSVIMIGGGTAKTGAPLLQEIRSLLRTRAADSPFIASLRLDERVALVDARQPIGCIGAACAMAAVATK
ncbi:MAG: ROK family protein [Bifidobacterium sp.]|nr:ROK family protein [Bifidobacterium sp.]